MYVYTVEKFYANLSTSLYGDNGSFVWKNMGEIRDVSTFIDFYKNVVLQSEISRVVFWRTFENLKICLCVRTFEYV